MRERLLLGALTLAAIVAVGSCTDDVGPTEVQTFTANLDAAQEVPTNASTATATATISVVGGVLVYRIDGTNVTNANFGHIHGPAVAGVNNSVIVNFCGTGAPAPPCASGTGVLAAGVATQVNGMSFDRLLNLLRTDSAYVNIHTTAFPAGEIRGQIHRQ